MPTAAPQTGQEAHAWACRCPQRTACSPHGYAGVPDVPADIAICADHQHVWPALDPVDAVANELYVRVVQPELTWWDDLTPEMKEGWRRAARWGREQHVTPEAVVAKARGLQEALEHQASDPNVGESFAEGIRFAAGFMVLWLGSPDGDPAKLHYRKPLSAYQDVFGPGDADYILPTPPPPPDRD